MCAGHNNLLLAAGGPVRRRPIAHGLVLRRARRRQQTMETAHKFGPLTLICLWCSSNSPRPPPPPNLLGEKEKAVVAISRSTAALPRIGQAT